MHNYSFKIPKIAYARCNESTFFLCGFWQAGKINDHEIMMCLKETGISEKKKKSTSRIENKLGNTEVVEDGADWRRMDFYGILVL